MHQRPEASDPTRYNHDAIDHTTALIDEAGYGVDLDLWGPPDGDLISVAANSP
ncbi:hypothetical protein ACO0M4_26230 [Streptomyces sp. RGM 3693]|uniref:hypothetical protein n=1 Tax=Streptomyces sp. RGM 3693 TaxID=3413284 RepID=UPI003D293BD4